jgi:hypothetical protein
MKHLVGTFNEIQLINKEDKIAIEKAKKETGLCWIESKINVTNQSITIWLLPSPEFNSNEI